MSICDCCGENEVGDLGREHGYQYCDECCKTTRCDQCDCETDEHYLWESAVCESCQAKLDRWSWFDETIEAIELAAKAGGWHEERDQQAQTGTRYITFWRDGKADDDESETITIRVADHGDCYCTADCSVVMPGRESGDDVSLETVLRRLA